MYEELQLTIRFETNSEGLNHKEQCVNMGEFRCTTLRDAHLLIL